MEKSLCGSPEISAFPGKLLKTIDTMNRSFNELLKTPRKLYLQLLKMKGALVALRDVMKPDAFSGLLAKYNTLALKFSQSPGLGAYTVDQMKADYQQGLDKQDQARIDELNLQADGERFIDRFDYLSHSVGGQSDEDIDASRGLYDTNGDGAFAKYHEAAELMRQAAKE